MFKDSVKNQIHHQLIRTNHQYFPHLIFPSNSMNFGF